MDAVGIDTSEPSQADDEPVESSVEICRVCLHGNLIMRDLFVESDVVSLSTKAMSFASVKMIPGDGLPGQVCCDCADKLESAYEFKLQVEQADSVLRERYDSLNIKEELFFNEVEVHLEAERHEDVPEIDVDAQYEAAAETLNVGNDKSNLLKDHLALLQVEKLAEEEQSVLDHQEMVQEHSTMVQTVEAPQDESLKQQMLQEDGEYLNESDEHTGQQMLEAGDVDEEVKTEALNDGEGITIEEHNYIVQQGYTLTNEQEQELMQQDNEDNGSQGFPTLMLDDEEGEEVEETEQSPLKDNSQELVEAEETDEAIKSQRLSRKDSDQNSDEDNYFENLNLSSRLKQFQEDKSDKVFFMCYLCDKQFVSKEILKEHMHSHEEVRKTLSLKKTPEKTQKAVTPPTKSQPSGKKANKCPYCGKEYLYVISFNKHIKQHEKNEDELKESTEITNNDESLDSDGFDNSETFEVIHDDKPEPMDFEENQGTIEDNDEEKSKASIKRQILHSEKCSICDEEFDSVEKLRDHRATHVMEGVLTEQELRDELASICNKEYEETGQLKTEEAEGQRDLKCPHCSMTFMSKKLLGKHIDTHERTKYRCKICNQEFTKKDHLRKHAEHHAKVKTFKCTECNKVFGNELTLRNHLIATSHRTIVQGEEYDPNKRIKRVAAKAAQKIIDKIKTEDGLEDSEREDDNDEFLGDEQKSGDKLSRRSVHRKDLECATCGKRCSSKQYLMKHMEQHTKDEKDVIERAKKNVDMREYHKNSMSVFDREDDDNDDDDDDFESGLDWPMDTHECTTCKKRYSTKKSLLRHQLLHEEPNFECDICNVKFYRKDKLKAHYDKCSEKNPDQVRKCNICGDTFENNEILREHRSKHVDEGILTEEDLRELEPGSDDRKHGEKIARKRRTDIVGLECTECNKQYTSRKGLLRHIQVHEGKKYLCDICPKKFYRREHLKIHVAKHNMVKPYKCTRCSKRFIKEEQLAAHLTKHERTFKKNKEADSTSKRFLCEICSKSFTQSTTLVAHLRAHNGIKPYVCEVCARPFTTNAYLKMHMRTHTQERPYSCQYCSRAFARADTLANHLTSHTGEAKYHCKYCPKNFRRLKSLKEHVFIHTGQRPYACPTCDRRFNNNGSRYAHSKRCKQNLLQNQTRQTQVQTQIVQPVIEQQPQATQQIQPIQQVQQVQQIQVQQIPQANTTQQTIRLAQAVGPTMQVVQSKNIKTITITRQTDQVGQHQVMQHQEILMPLILPLTVTLTDVDEEVILPEGTKIFTTT